MKHREVVRLLFRSTAVVAAVPLLTTIAFVVHGKVLTASLLDLVLVMLIANRWGFIQTVVASVTAAASLDFFYMPPIYSLYERDPQDWISSGTFVTLALAVGYIADRIKRSAVQNENERTRLEKL